MYRNSFLSGEWARISMPFFKALIAGLVIFNFSNFFFVHAKIPSPPFSFEYLPTPFSDVDTIAVKYSLGSQSSEAGPSTSFSFVHDYSALGYTINPNSQIVANWDDSWACEDGNCNVTVSVDHDDEKIYITVSRTDEIAQIGYGTIVVLEGIIVEIDVIHARKFISNPQLIYDRSKIQIKHQEKINQVDIFDLSGRVQKRYYFDSQNIKIPMYAFPTGIYVLLIRTESNAYSEKIILPQ